MSRIVGLQVIRTGASKSPYAFGPMSLVVNGQATPWKWYDQQDTQNYDSTLASWSAPRPVVSGLPNTYTPPREDYLNNLGSTQTPVPNVDQIISQALDASPTPATGNAAVAAPAPSTKQASKPNQAITGGDDGFIPQSTTSKGSEVIF